jgi:hypothetical protein
MLACGANEWSEVEGRTIIALRGDDDRSTVVGIAPLPTERGTRFVFAQLADEFRASRDPGRDLRDPSRLCVNNNSEAGNASNQPSKGASG